MERTEIEQLGEFGLIRRLTQEIKHQQSSTLLGVGDDAAVVDSGDKRVVLSTDMLVEGVHFDMSYVPLKHLGYKAVSVNLSLLENRFVEPSVYDECRFRHLDKRLLVLLSVRFIHRQTKRK